MAFKHTVRTGGKDVTVMALGRKEALDLVNQLIHSLSGGAAVPSLLVQDAIVGKQEGATPEYPLIFTIQSAAPVKDEPGF